MLRSVEDVAPSHGGATGVALRAQGRTWARGPRGHGAGAREARPRTCGEQPVTAGDGRPVTGPPPRVRGAVGRIRRRLAPDGSTPARAGSSLPDLHLYLGKSPFHANFAMSATLASAVRIPPPLPRFRCRALHAWPSRSSAGRSTEPRRHCLSVPPLGAGDGPDRGRATRLRKGDLPSQPRSGVEKGTRQPKPADSRALPQLPPSTAHEEANRDREFVAAKSPPPQSNPERGPVTADASSSGPAL